MSTKTLALLSALRLVCDSVATYFVLQRNTDEAICVRGLAKDARETCESLIGASFQLCVNVRNERGRALTGQAGP
eukprot:6213056-Pleurochrysis_carterae.AAC.4